MTHVARKTDTFRVTIAGDRPEVRRRHARRREHVWVFGWNSRDLRRRGGFGSDRVVERGVEGHRGGLLNRRRGLAVLCLGREGF